MARKLPRPEHCLNCGEKITGNYCAACGQKNTIRRVSIRLLLSEFLDDYFDFDSKLFRSVFFLIFRPGHLTVEYNAGKRVTYIRPFRLYLTASLIYFFILSFQISSLEVNLGNKDGDLKLGEIGEAITDSIAVIAGDSIRTRDGLVTLDMSQLGKLAESPAGSLLTETVPSMADLMEDSTVHITVFGMKDGEIDSVMERMRAARDDTASSYINSKLKGFLINRYDRLKGMTVVEFIGELKSSFVKNLPKMMFFLLPVFALILKVIYPLSKRFYVEYLIFSLHFHAFMFLFLTLVMVIHYDTLLSLTPLVILLYLFIAMWTAYGQSVWRTTLKFVSLLFVYMMVLVIAFGGTLFGSMMFI